MSYRWMLVALCFPCALALPMWVYDINRGLDEMLRGLDEPGRSEFWSGIVGLIVCVLVLEYGRRFSAELWEEDLRTRPPDTEAPKWNQVVTLQWGFLIVIHCSGLLAFATTMDGGTRWAATRWVYLIYAVPALALVALRWRRWTRLERLFLRWGWAPVLAFGVPLALPDLLAAGLIEIR
jgi:hypothetical protein